MNTENITVNTQSSIRIGGTRVLYFDPFQIQEERHDADIVLITHAHYDHFDPESIKHVITEKTVIIAPFGMRKEVSEISGGRKVHLMTPGETVNVGDAQIEAVPAYNRLKPFHPRRNNWLGYIVTLDGVRYYVAGDTDAVKELSDVSCDVALIPVGGKFTIDAKDAAKLIHKIRPEVAIPTHYGSIVGKKEDADIFRKGVDKDIIVETRL